MSNDVVRLKSSDRIRIEEDEGYEFIENIEFEVGDDPCMPILIALSYNHHLINLKQTGGDYAKLV